MAPALAPGGEAGKESCGAGSGRIILAESICGKFTCTLPGAGTAGHGAEREAATRDPLSNVWIVS